MELHDLGLLDSQDVLSYSDRLDATNEDEWVAEVRQLVKSVLIQCLPAHAPVIGRLIEGEDATKALSLGLPDRIPNAANLVAELKAAIANPPMSDVRTPLGVMQPRDMPEILKRCHITVVNEDEKRPPTKAHELQDARAAARKRLDEEAELDALLEETGSRTPTQKEILMGPRPNEPWQDFEAMKDAGEL